MGKNLHSHISASTFTFFPTHMSSHISLDIQVASLLSNTSPLKTVIAWLLMHRVS